MYTGRIKELDDHIKAAKAIDESLLNAVTTEAERLTGAQASHAKHYITFVKNIIAKGIIIIIL